MEKGGKEVRGTAAARGSRASLGKREQRKESTSTLIIDVNPCHRYSLLILNLVTMLVSGVLVAGSAYSLYMRWHEVHTLKEAPLLGLLVNLEFPYIALGILSFLSASAGFVGALRENVTLLDVYSTAVLILMVINFLLGFVVVLSPFLTKRTIQGLVSIHLIEHYRDNEDFQALIDYIQTTFKCCGVTVDSFRDWNRSIYFNCTKDNPSAERCSVPSSCCRPVDGEDENVDVILTRRFCGQNVLSLTDQAAWVLIYPRSCADAVVDVARKNSIYLAMVILTAFIALIIVRIMAVTVREEIEALSMVYDRYYKAVQKGLKKELARQQALELAPEDYIVEIPTPHRAEATSPTAEAPALPKHVPPPHTPAAVFDGGISYGVIPHVTRFRAERQQMLAAWRCPRHNVKRFSFVYDINCEACRRLHAAAHEEVEQPRQ